MVALASSRGGSNSGNTPRNCHGPSPSARATPKERKPRAANSLTALSTAGFTCPALADNARITCGAPLVTLNCLSVLAFDGGLGAFMHRVEGQEMNHLIALQRILSSFSAAEDGQIDGVVICPRATPAHHRG